MHWKVLAGLIFAVLVASPALAFADFNDTARRAQGQANSLTSEQLDNLNTRVVNDAYVTARINGYDPAEIEQLKADVAALKQENARLRSQTQASAPATSSDLEARVSRLEVSLGGLQSTLKLVVTMLHLLHPFVGELQALLPIADDCDSPTRKI